MPDLDVVNENDEIVGTDTRENIHRNGLLHREIHIWIFNDKGEVLLQRRSETKDTYPGLLDVSVGGHLEVGEDYETTAIRELAEEVCVKAEKDDLISLDKLRRSAFDAKTGMKNNTIRKIFAYRYNGSADDLKLEIGEATSLEFWPLEKILNLTDQEKKDFVPAIIDGSFSEIFEKIKEKIINGTIVNPINQGFVKPHINWLLKSRILANEEEKRHINLAIILFSVIFFEGFLERVLIELDRRDKFFFLKKIERISGWDSKKGYSYKKELDKKMPVDEILNQEELENVKNIFNLRHLIVHGSNDVVLVNVNRKGEIKPLRKNDFDDIVEFIFKKGLSNQKEFVGGNFSAIFSDSVSDWVYGEIASYHEKFLKYLEDNFADVIPTIRFL